MKKYKHKPDRTPLPATHKWNCSAKLPSSSKELGNWNTGHSDARNEKLAAGSVEGRAAWTEDSYRKWLLSNPQKRPVINTDTGQIWLSRGRCAADEGVQSAAITKRIQRKNSPFENFN